MPNGTKLSYALAFDAEGGGAVAPLNSFIRIGHHASRRSRPRRIQLRRMARADDGLTHRWEIIDATMPAGNLTLHAKWLDQRLSNKRSPDSTAPS
ncbi:MAG: hypothetical protein MZU97_12910 [Bacillus subtilis]|nr:hypothetical protein [Bacillus subtilis]